MNTMQLNWHPIQIPHKLYNIFEVRCQNNVGKLCCSIVDQRSLHFSRHCRTKEANLQPPPSIYAKHIVVFPPIWSISGKSYRCSSSAGDHFWKFFTLSFFLSDIETLSNKGEQSCSEDWNRQDRRGVGHSISPSRPAAHVEQKAGTATKESKLLLKTCKMDGLVCGVRCDDDDMMEDFVPSSSVHRIISLVYLLGALAKGTHPTASSGFSLSCVHLRGEGFASK